MLSVVHQPYLLIWEIAKMPLGCIGGSPYGIMISGLISFKDSINSKDIAIQILTGHNFWTSSQNKSIDPKINRNNIWKGFYDYRGWIPNLALFGAEMSLATLKGIVLLRRYAVLVRGRLEWCSRIESKRAWVPSVGRSGERATASPSRV